MVKAFITIFALLAATVSAGPMSTCGEQSDCIIFSEPVKTEGTCDGDCEWKVCMDLSGIGLGSCVKDSGTVSHTCVMPENVCATGTLDFRTGAEATDLTSTFVQCQTGKGGDTLYFLLKDGSGCADSSGVWPAGSSTPKAECVPTNFLTAESSPSCTGNGSGVECVWSYKLPTCEAPPPPPPPPPSNCPKGNGVCYTSDCECVMGKCKITPSASFASVLEGYTGADGYYTLKSTCESGKALSNAVKIPSSGICVKEDILVENAGTTFTVQVVNGVLVTPFSMKCGTDCFIYGSFPYTCNASNEPARVQSGLVANAAGSSVGTVAGLVAAVAMVGLVVGVFVYKKRVGKFASENNHDLDTVVAVITPRRSGDDY